MIGIVDVFVFIADFLLAVVRLLQEDLLWLRSYFQSLTNWDCILFLLLLLLYVLLWRFILGLLAWGARKILGRLGLIDKFLENYLLSNPDYRNGYELGYSEGEKERRRPKTLWQKIKSWF